MTNRKIEYWVIPPEADAEFTASMEEVLETYENRMIQRFLCFAWTSNRFNW